MKKHSLAALTALLLAVLTATASFAGCGTSALLSETGRTDSAQTTGSTGSLPTLTTPAYHTPVTPEKDETYTPEYQLQLLADRDFEGAVFLAVQEEGLENAIFPSADELTGVYADRRNRLIQEKYNVELACISKSADDILSELSKAKTTGSYFADLLVVSPALFAQLKQKGLLQALDSLPFFEADSACIRADAIREINSAWSGTYGLWGDALRQPTRAYAVYYNIAQAAEMDCPNFYSKVVDGSWDMTALLDSAMEGKLVFDGDASNLLFAASRLASTTEEGQALPESQEFLDLLTAFDSCRYLSEEESALEAFMAGKTLFYIGQLSDLKTLSQADVQAGLLPIPKYSTSDANYPYLVDQSTLPILACPINVASEAGTVIMLSALNAASCDEIEEIFLQSAETHVRDNGSTLVLPYCIGTLQFDRKLIYGE